MNRKDYKEIARIIKKNTTLANKNGIVKVVLIREMLIKDLADYFEEEFKLACDRFESTGLTDTSILKLKKFSRRIFLLNCGVSD